MIRGQVLYYPSKLDEILQPLPICATDNDPTPKPLILDLSPGAIADLGQSARQCEQYVRFAVEAGETAIVAKPCGRGPGSVYQGPGEVDLFEAIDFICEKFAVDPERISVMGGSMGGAATWYIASHYPDRFAAAAPFCGYCDYSLWTKPGGLIMRNMPWEEYSWQSRGAAYRAQNLCNMAVWMIHGEWDIGIGGGVPIEHSKQMARRFDELGIDYEFTIVPECGHGCMSEDQLRQVVPWLCRQRRAIYPQRVQLVAHCLRHNRSFWLSIDAFDEYGQPASVDATFADEVLRIDAQNVKTFSVGPLAKKSAVHIDLPGIDATPFDLTQGAHSFTRSGSGWQLVEEAAVSAGEKRRGCSGPFGDLFFAPLHIVKGTRGSAQENFLQNWMADCIPGYFRQTNGGVHRGIFNGESYYQVQVIDDEAVSDELLRSANLILWGTDQSNSVLAKLIGDLPLAFEPDGVVVGGRKFSGKNVGLAACFPHPLNAQRYVAVVGGISPESITNATHLNLQLLPDYLVWDGDEVLASGYFDASWRL